MGLWSKIKSRLSGFWKTNKTASLIIVFGLILFQTSEIIWRDIDPTKPIWLILSWSIAYFSLVLGLILIGLNEKVFIFRFFGKIKARLFKIWSKHKVGILILVFGLALFYTTVIILRSTDPIMPYWVSLMRYTSYFSWFLGLLLIAGKRKWYIASNVIVVVMLVLIVEIVCFWLMGFPNQTMKIYEAQEFAHDNRARYLGYSARVDTTYIEHKFGPNGDTLFSATYTLDKQGHRFTPEIDSTNGKYSLFFGCSIALGYGLNDDQTLAYHFQNESKSKAYNYAWNGYGTNHMLALIQNEKLNKEVKEKDGTGYYIFFWDHIFRSVCSMKYYTQWLYTSPYYYLEGDKLVHDRSFVDGRYWQSTFYEYLSQSAIKNYFEIEHPFKLNESHFDLVTEMILESKKEYKRQFGNDDFVVVIYPAYKAYTKRQMKEFLGYLRKKKIRYVDLSNTIKYSGKYSLNGDAHPSSETNALLAKKLFEKTK
ncbi:MAG: hypothetical protein ACJA0U_001147 [Salibacteraceae bacterium]|jgi:hypothetical protein